MATTVGNIFRLSRAGFVLAQHGVRFVPEGTKVPFALYLARAATLPIRVLTWPFRARPAQGAPGRGRHHQPRPQLHQARPVPRHPRRSDRAGPRQRPAAPAGPAAALLHGRGPQGHRGAARRQAGGPFRRVRPAHCGGLHRPGAQGGGDRQRRAPRRGRQGAAARHREAVQARSRQLFFRRPSDRALPPADPAAASRRRGRDPGAFGPDRDGHAAGGCRHLGDGRQYRQGSDTRAWRLPRADRRLAAARPAAC